MELREAQAPAPLSLGGDLAEAEFEETGEPADIAKSPLRQKPLIPSTLFPNKPSRWKLKGTAKFVDSVGWTLHKSMGVSRAVPWGGCICFHPGGWGTLLPISFHTFD